MNNTRRDTVRTHRCLVGLVSFVFRCAIAPLYKALSVRLSNRRSVTPSRSNERLLKMFEITQKRLWLGLIELEIGLIELEIGLIEFGIGLRINNARRTFVARVSGLVSSYHLSCFHYRACFYS